MLLFSKEKKKEEEEDFVTRFLFSIHPMYLFVRMETSFRLIDRSTLERYGDGFEKHTTYDHNIWSYLFFFIHLLEKDQTEYTGAEQYIWDRVRIV